MKRLLPFALAFWLLLSSCAAGAGNQSVTPPPSATATTMARSLPIFASTPVPLPENLLAQKDLLEYNGFIFGGRKITRQDESRKEWPVVEFNVDGSAVIMALNTDYQGKELTLTAEEAAQITLEPLNVGHDPTLVIKDKETGQVVKMFLPNVDKNDRTGAGWVAPIDISNDPSNPTKIPNAGAVHTGHVLYSAFLGKGREPWPEDFPTTKFIVESFGQYIKPYHDKLAIIDLYAMGFDSEGNEVASQSRSIGFIELNTPRGKILVNLIQCKIGDDGNSVVMGIGYGGGILDLPGFYENYLPPLYRILLYQAVGNKLDLTRGGLQGMPGVRYLYESDIDNKPWQLFPDEIGWLATLKVDDLKAKGQGQRRDITGTKLLDKLQGFIFHPIFP